ncbi:dUTP diphosphatase [Thalassobacillus devorans]|uniref:dUTP diphosphatase n=1 Tax=Thalassobacillus devorans TaxID=279813 RepID=UPI00048E72BE|nr:dUTP diphosphatase [Thalassobacillus devorans]
MNWDELFQTQLQLDRYIEANHQLEEADLFEDKVLALLVEVGELANETRCFKFWSQKPASPEDVILEEYVDGLHFMLSLGLEKELRYEEQPIKPVDDLSGGFHQVYEDIVKFKSVPKQKNFQQMFSNYLSLGAGLGFSEQAIQYAYHKKNARNHQRQDEGY